MLKRVFKKFLRESEIYFNHIVITKLRTFNKVKVLETSCLFLFSLIIG